IVYRPSQSGVFNAYLDPTVMVTTWNVGRVDFELFRIDRKELIRSERSDLSVPYQPPVGSLIRLWSETIANPPLDEPVVTPTRLAEPGARLPQGVYYLRVSAPGVHSPSGFAFVVSSANVTVKWTDREALVWAVDLRSGAPLVAVPLDVLDRDGRVIASGVTRDDGVARIPLADVTVSNQPFGNGYYISAETPNMTLLAGSLWTDGIAPWNFPDISFTTVLPDLVGYVYTDRPIYRPGETVYIKGVVRSDDDARYAVPPRDPDLRLILRDSFGRVFDERPVDLSDMGTFDTEVQLNPEAATGTYSIELQRGEGAAETSYPTVGYVLFQVAEFRKPEFEVAVTPGRESYVNGETIRATVQADLFFGAPLADADVRWQATSQPFFFSHEDYPGYSFADYQPRYDYADGPFYEIQQRVRSEGVGRTDARGRFSLSLPADVSADPVSQIFNLEATVTDENGRSVSAVAPVVVHKGRFYIGLKPESYVAFADEPAAMALVTLDPDGEPVGNVGVTIRVYERKWRTVRERDELGQQRYRSEPEDTLVETLEARTAADGTGAFDFTPPRSGQYYVVAEARDDAGNVIKASTFLWASSSEYASWRVGNDDVIELVADRDEYAPGDVARILVAAPFEESQGLVTLERGRIFEYSLWHLATTSDVLEIPITDDHIPTVYVSVTLFKPPTAENPMP
ncbi:MAG TPA: MG2 domain-containing protein, partial [Dehalococcoidia bacterium]|nr:MG2 domain-containing protein [Dehalococcoidia bacterium]